MFVFALVLETLLHQLVLNSAFGKTIRGNIWLYALYGGLAAAVFEESGRYLAFRTVLRRYQRRDVNALMYAAGHGGCEAAFVYGMTMVSNLVLAAMINLGMTHLLLDPLSGETLAQGEAQLTALIETAPAEYLAGLGERLLALPLQGALSVFVWFAAKKKEKRFLLPCALALHFTVDAATVLAASAWPLWAVECLIALMSAVSVVLAVIVWKRNASPDEPQSVPADASEPAPETTPD